MPLREHVYYGKEDRWSGGTKEGLSMEEVRDDGVCARDVAGRQVQEQVRR